MSTTNMSLSAGVTTRPVLAHGAPRRAGGSGAFMRLFGLLQLWHRRVIERRTLCTMDDRALLDIGLTRADAMQLADKPFWRA